MKGMKDRGEVALSSVVETQASSPNSVIYWFCALSELHSVYPSFFIL